MITIFSPTKDPRFLFFSLLLLSLGAPLWYWSGAGKRDLEFHTVGVSTGEITQVVTGTGQLNPEETVQVGCQISGRIQKLYVDFNSIVTKGDVLAQIDPASYQALVHQAEGELAHAKAVLELSQLEAIRLEELGRRELIPRADLDKALAELHQAEAIVKVQDAALEKTKVDLAHCSIHAPMNGMVSPRNVDVGQTVAASLCASTLFLIAK